MKKIVFFEKNDEKNILSKIKKKKKKDNSLNKKKHKQGFIKKRVCSLELYN